MPIHATPASARPIHTPLPSSTNSATISSVVISASIDSLRSALGRRRRAVALAAASRSTSSSTNAIARTTVPTAIAICGIHSGVASLPVEMSWNSKDCQASRALYHAKQRCRGRRRRRATTAQRAPRRAGQALEEQRHADVLAALRACARAPGSPRRPCSSRRRRRCPARGSRAGGRRCRAAPSRACPPRTTPPGNPAASYERSRARRTLLLVAVRVDRPSCPRRRPSCCHSASMTLPTLLQVRGELRRDGLTIVMPFFLQLVEIPAVLLLRDLPAARLGVGRRLHERPAASACRARRTPSG